MRKLLIGTLCALTMAASSGCFPGEKLKEITPTYRIYTVTKEGYKVTLSKQGDSVSIHLYDPNSKRDTIQVADNDFKKKNGVDVFSNFTLNEYCTKKSKPKCTPKQIKKANELFKYGLDALGLDNNLKPKNDLSGGW
jgi:hypothetical protein